MQPSELSLVSEPHNNTLEVTDTADDDPRSSSTTFIDETLTEIRKKEYKPNWFSTSIASFIKFRDIIPSVLTLGEIGEELSEIMLFKIRIFCQIVVILSQMVLILRADPHWNTTQCPRWDEREAGGPWPHFLVWPGPAPPPPDVISFQSDLSYLRLASSSSLVAVRWYLILRSVPQSLPTCQPQDILHNYPKLGQELILTIIKALIRQ